MISIIVPIYNTEKYLPQCIDSIIEQTYTDLEIILVDDGSIDDSGKICDEYALKDSRIKVIHKENNGLVSARQAGINVAAGEYIGFVDSDDWIEQDMYQTLYDVTILEKADIVVEGAVDEFEGKCTASLNQLPAGKYATSSERRNLYKKMICCKDFFCLGIQPYLWNKLFCRKLVLQHMNKIPQSICVGEDAAAVYPMLAMAESVVILDTAHYHYCHRENSMMLGSRDEKQEYDNAILLYSFLKKSFMEFDMYHLFERQLNRYTINNLMVRAYGRVASAGTKSILFPFSNICEGDTIIIYGAGALGRAVYQYAVSCGKLIVKAFVDQNAGNYKQIGLNVCILEETDIGQSDKVVVAVFNRVAYQAINRSLTARNIRSEQIKWIDDNADTVLFSKLEEWIRNQKISINPGCFTA